MASNCEKWCHAHTHGLIHDGRLWAHPIMAFRVNVRFKVIVRY
jgi:hypothetical protein